MVLFVSIGMAFATGCGGSGTGGGSEAASGAGTPTRLVGHAVFVRFDQPRRFPGAEHALAYALIFRLNRDPLSGSYVSSVNMFADNASTSRGNYSLGQHFSFQNPEVPVHKLGSAAHPPASPPVHCFVGEIPYVPDAPPVQLAKIKIGHRIRFLARPLTASGDRLKLGTTYTQQLTLLAADPMLRRPAIRQALTRMGCRNASDREFAR